MIERRYFDFVLFVDDLQILVEADSVSFYVRVFDSPVGQGEKEKVEISYQSFEKLREKCIMLQNGYFDEDIKDQYDLGEQLFKLLFPQSALEFYRESRNWLRNNEGMRIRLRIPGELDSFPWEFMYYQREHGERGSNNFLACDPDISIVRHVSLAKPHDWFEPSQELRIAVVMASPAGTDKLPELPKEQLLLKDLFNKINGVHANFSPEYSPDDVGGDFLSATIKDLEDAVKDGVDIFQFSGHGEFEKRVSESYYDHQGEGFIILGHERNRKQKLSGSELASILSNKGVRLVILGACETGQSDRFHAWSGVAKSLIRERIPAVVAMQHNIGDSYARAFTYAFYPPLLAGGTIDEAVEAGRASIRSETRQKEYPIPDPDWGSPVLYLRTHSGQIIQPVSVKDIRAQAARLSDGQTSMYHIWWGWETMRESASEVQLKTLEDGADKLDIPPIELILLLRSTLEKGQPAATWIERLRNTGGDYIQRLDDHKEPTASGSETVALLGLDEKTQHGRPQNTGPIAWAAVQHPDHIIRKTAALSLTAIQPTPEIGLDRLHSVLNQVGGRWSFHRWSLQSELHGALADVDPKLDGMTGQLALIDRFGVWMWRIRQRVHQDRERIAFLVLGAALGAGLALGLWRALIAAIAPAQSIAIRFSISFFWGALLGMCVGLAIGLVRPLMVRYRKWNEKADQHKQEYGGPDRKQAWLSVIMGTVFFGVAHVFVALSNGLPLNERWLVLISGAIAGFGINLALYGQPHSGKRSGVGGWVIRLMAAALLAIFAQWLVFRIQPLLPNFTQGDELWAVSSITRRGSSYADYFSIFQDLSVWLRANQDKVSYFDAAVVNVLMTIGIALGVYKGVDWLAHWISDESD